MGFLRQIYTDFTIFGRLDAHLLPENHIFAHEFWAKNQ